MRIFMLSALLAALSFTSFAYADTDAKQVALKVQGALVSIPNSSITLELGQYTTGLAAMQAGNGTLTIQMASQTPQSGFVIKGLSLSQFKVVFMPKGADKAADIDPSIMADHAFTYLPLPAATGGGMFTITLPGLQPIMPKQAKAFLN